MNKNLLDINIKNLLQEYKIKISELKKDVRIKDINNKIKKLESITLEKDFWDSFHKSNKIMKDLSRCKALISDFKIIYDKNEDLIITFDMLFEDFNETSYKNFIGEYENFKKEYEDFIKKITYSDKDNKDVYLEIKPGEGGLDSKDFSRMLFRMYTRWCEKNNYSFKIIEVDQDFKSNGINKALISIKGENIYGQLKSEHGIHRLIRNSPFNSSNKRQTSFSLVNVFEQVNTNREIKILDKDLKIDTFKSSGSGGQSVNTTDSAVRIRHIPTNIIVTCRNERSQLQNKETALKILVSKLKQHELNLIEQNKKKNIKKTIGFGNQIRTYVLNPYSLVKDHRTFYEETNVSRVFDGELNGFISSYLNFCMSHIEK